MYRVPTEYYFRLHHIRPRFKNNIEDVLVYMATEITRLGPLPHCEFREKMNNAIRNFTGNTTKECKTINNWRTEISALFGFMETLGGNTKPGLRAIELAENQDLVESFKVFLYNFQYPGAHIKPNRVLEQIEAGVKFKPAQYILKLMKAAEEQTGERVGFTKAEITHCVFNDLRCTRDNRDVNEVWQLIKSNRDNDIEYDQSGDIIRYAGDILDYMEIANLLVCYDGRNYYINQLENTAILRFVNSKEWFSKYDYFINNRSATLEQIKSHTESWFSYVNKEIQGTDFETDILAFISENQEEYTELKKKSYDLFEERLEKKDSLTTKDIGDIGESLVHGHECERVKRGGGMDLIHLIKRIPTHFAVGYDIQSVEIDKRKRYIEVKTTISSRPLNFNKIHLTPNEWATADTLEDRYFVYRLMISKGEKKLFIIQNPVGLYKKDIIQMIPRDGADIVFNTDNSGNFEELLIWTN